MSKYLVKNSKMKLTEAAILGQFNEVVSIFNFNLPEYKSADGTIICPMAKECIKFCYVANKASGYKRFGDAPAKAMERNFEAAKNESFVDEINKEIKSKRSIDYVRIHDSGDFYSRTYLRKWFKIMELNPNVKFYAYTNMVTMFRRAKLNNEVPSNFDYSFSASGGAQSHLIDKDKERHSMAFGLNATKKDGTKSKKIDKKATIKHFKALGYGNAAENDLMMTRWYNTSHKVGLVFH